jgi:ParB-like chromosome segregation protein Spo0J
MNMKKPEEIKTHPTFESLFPIKPAVLAKIEQDMSDGTYDLSQPIILAIWEGLEEQVCIDGHTRLQAALNTGIEEVPVWLHEFDTEEEALEKAIQLQSNRRNMTDAELVTCIETLDKKKPRGGDRRSDAARSKRQHCPIENGSSSSAQETGDLLGISERKVRHVRTVMDHADEDIKEALKQGDMSINQAYQKTQKKRKQTEADTSDEQASYEGQEVEDADEAKQSAPDEKRELEQAPQAVGQTEEPTVPQQPYQNSSSRMVRFFLPEWQHAAFIRLGGFMETHLTKAVAFYLESLGIREEEDDDDEYFDPDTYEDD